MVRHLKILAWIHVVMGGGLLLLALVMLVNVLLNRPSSYAIGFLSGLVFWLSVVLFLPSLAGGIGLLHERLWARFLIIGVSVELLLAVPFGTALGVYGLWTLFNRETKSVFGKRPAWQFRIDQRLRGFLLAMLSVAAAFVLVLGGGFLLSRRPVAVIPMNNTFGIIAGLALVAIAFLIARLLGIPTRKRTVLRSKPFAPATQQGTAPLPPIPQLSADLKTAYANNHGMTITCVHLQPFERAMRAAAIPVVPVSESSIKADCRIHRPALERQFGLPERVTYREFFIPERYFEDSPTALFQCTQHHSGIEVLHPYDCNQRTRWFPAPPPPLVLVAEHTFASQIGVTAIASSPSGRFVAVAAGTYNTPQELIVWDAAKCKPVRHFPPHGVIRSIAWSSDEKVLVTGRGIPWSQGPGSPGASIFVWDAATGTEMLRFGSDLFGVRGIAISADGRTLLASGMLGETPAEGSTLDLWEIVSGRLLTRLARVDAHAHETFPFFSGVAFTPDGTLALTACDYDTLPASLRRRDKPDLPSWWGRGVRAWKLSDGQEVDLIPQPTPVRALSVSSDGTRLLVTGARFGVWNLTNRSLLWDKRNGYAGLAASPDCRLVARGTGYRVDISGPYDDTAVELYDGSTGELISLGEHRTPPVAIAFTSGTTLVAGGPEGELRFWRCSPDFTS